MKNEMMKSKDSLALREELEVNLNKLAIMRRPPSIQDCVSAKIIANYPEEILEKVSNLVFIELEKTVRWFNLNDFKKPNAELLLMWADSLVDQYELESVEDFVRFFTLIRKGTLDLNFFERLGYDVIQKAFSKYLGEMKLPERERQIKNKKIEHQKDVDRSEVVNGYAETLKIINNSIIKKVVEVKKSKSSFSKESEIKELRMNISGYPDKTLHSLRNQYENLSSIRGGKVVRDKGLKIIESRLSLNSLKKELNGKD
jgi:hypothetical protein